MGRNRRSLLVVLIMGVTLPLGILLVQAQQTEAITEAAQETPVPAEEDLISDMLTKEMRDVYRDEDYDTFMTYFSEDDYPNFETLRENMEYTFDNNDDLNLNITVNSVTIADDTAVVRADWTKRWDTGSSSSGINNTIRLKKIEGSWKITSIDNEYIFVIGSGTVSGSVTDR